MIAGRWSDRDHAAAMFDAAAVVFAPRTAVRAETAADVDFVEALAMACSPLAGILPVAMIRQQAAFQRIGHAEAYPTAMRRIILRDGRSVGRLAVDWSPEASRCIDIALLPEARGSGIGTALLGAWLTVADRLSLPATLTVRRDNPAIALYHRLGFIGHGDPVDALLAMSRVR